MGSPVDMCLRSIHPQCCKAPHPYHFIPDASSHAPMKNKAGKKTEARRVRFMAILLAAGSRAYQNTVN